MKGFEWKGSGPIRKGSILLATGFGLGLSPFASGTVGTVLGVALVVGLGLESLISQIALAVLCVILAVPICDVAEKHFGTKDDGRVVADEYLTFPLCVIGLPWQGAPYLLVMAFLTHRVLDIIKPPPANGLQRIHGGVGITIDDVVSSLYALGLNHAIYWWGIAPLLTK